MNKIGNILRQTHPSISNASIFPAIRCFSSSKLFVGGLSYATDENSLREAFAPYGDVIEARVIVDRETGRSRGFGFISYPSVEEASAAIQALDGRDLHGRFVRVAYASDQRGASRGPRFSSDVGYGTGFGATDGYGANSSQTGHYYGNGGGNYGSSGAGGFDSHSTAGSGSTGGLGDGYGGQHVSTVGGSYGGNADTDGNAGHYSSVHGGANNFNGVSYNVNGVSYNSTGQEHGSLQGSNLDNGKNDNNSYSGNGTHGYANARFG